MERNEVNKQPFFFLERQIFLSYFLDDFIILQQQKYFIFSTNISYLEQNGPYSQAQM